MRFSKRMIYLLQNKLATLLALYISRLSEVTVLSMDALNVKRVLHFVLHASQICRNKKSISSQLNQLTTLPLDTSLNCIYTVYNDLMTTYWIKGMGNLLACKPSAAPTISESTHPK